MSIIRAWSSLEASMLKKYNWRPDSEIGMLKIANRNNDEGHDDLEIVDHVLLPDVHHQGWSSLSASLLKKYNWRSDSEIEMLKIGNRNIRGAAASEGGTSLLDFFSVFRRSAKKKMLGKSIMYREVTTCSGSLCWSLLPCKLVHIRSHHLRFPEL